MHACAAPMTAGQQSPVRPRRRLRQAAALCVTAAALAVTGGAADASASGLFPLSNTHVNRIAQTGSKLYWTSNSVTSTGWTAAVYGASKSNTPGLETSLYGEFFGSSLSFGDLTITSTNAYFVDNHPSAGTSTIKRIPIPMGGQATTLTTSPGFIGARDLKNDGANLYWADAIGLEKMAITGGMITTLVHAGNIVSVGLNASRVYYSQGASIRSMSKSGTGMTVHTTTASAVTAMDLYTTSTGTAIYWGEQSGAVRSLAGTTTTYQSPLVGRRTSSVFFDGTRVLWLDCAIPNNDACAARKHQGSATTTVDTGGVNATDVKGDAVAMYFSFPTLWKYVH
jgi:hypothetical protein